MITDPNAPKPVITAIGIGPDAYNELIITSLSVIPDLLKRWPMLWINVDGVGDAGLVQEIGSIFNLHKLALEDVVNVHQRAKAEPYGDVLFVVAPMPLPNRVWEIEQLSLFLGRNFLISFQERPGGDCLDPVRLRIRAGVSRTRCLVPGYLAYALLDASIDNYFPLIEDCGERLDMLEDEVLGPPNRAMMPRILDVKRDLRVVRRAIWPLRDALNSLIRDQSPLIADETRIYLRDCHDHVIQIIDLLESYRDLASGLTDVYLSNVSNSTNEIVKVLTMFSTVFIPLTFIVGLYGMNFDRSSPWNMPELGWKYGYLFVWAVMIVVVLGALHFFWRRGWIGQRLRTLPPPADGTSRRP